ncbi:MAG: NUDIX domain-containing protein [Acidimicrobiales bacterium]
MPKRSAGLLVYRRKVGGEAAGVPGEATRASWVTGASGVKGALQVLLVHPGGPYWARRDDGWWSIPKGEVGEGEDELAAAEREFAEELGVPVPAGRRTPLGEVVQASGKRVRAWAVAGDLDATSARSVTFEMEWPPRSGTMRRFPEVDRAAWCTLAEARSKLLPGQLPLLDRLAEALAR